MQQAARSRMVAGTAVGVLTALLCVGCSAEIGGSTAVSKDEVAEKGSAALGKKIGREPDDVTCEKDLKAEVGATVRCDLTANGEKQGMTVTAKSVDGGNVKMDFKVDDAPGAGDSAEPTDSASTGAGGDAQSVDKAEVARQGKAALAAQVGREPDAFTCPQDLPAQVKAVIRCELTAEGQRYGVTVTAASVVNGKVDMDFKVDTTPKS
ncbi:DUF4333 domain-containing protein [Streptomyces sp. NPDC055239]